MDPILKEEKREMKRLKEYCNRLDYVADTQYGIPTWCPCGERIMNELSPNEVSETLPGKRFFTCKEYKADGLHFRQPWVVGVEQEIKKLTRRVEEAEKLSWGMYDMNESLWKMKEEIKKLTRRVEELEKLPPRDT